MASYMGTAGDIFAGGTISSGTIAVDILSGGMVDNSFSDGTEARDPLAWLGPKREGIWTAPVLLSA
ncbi:hypothetical protein DM860_008095 [Cuscuta australis]|uniref:Uncharacterized protein n=1 Tax=Cuscuta australis TaxID=267555 RepID=A0A328D2J4_9ASTE|nr:hypothetical protein DM860_008095 [Cuscuta australis]